MHRWTPLIAVVLAAALQVPLAGPSAADTDAPAGAPPLGSVPYPVPGDALYVAPTGVDLPGSGTRAAPFATVQYAVNRAPAGATIVLRGGTYREQATWLNKALTIQPQHGEEVWFSGSVPVDGWIRDGATWRKDGWTTAFKQGGVDARLIDPANPYAAYPDMLFVDGRALRQVGSSREVGPGTFAVDYATQRLYIGDDPAGRSVEAAVLSESLYANQASGSVIQGLGFRHFATHRERLAAVKAYGDRVVVRDSVFEHNAMAGLSIIGANALVERNTMRHNGQIGLHAYRADGLVVGGNLLQGNNVERFRMGSEQGGFKVTASHDVVIRDNVAEGNVGPGLWVDESVLGAMVVRNTSRDNDGHGITFEISARGVIASNIATGNGGNGIYVLESNDVEVWNNTLVDNRRNLMVLDGARTITDASMYGHDKRFAIPQAGLLWDIKNVTVRNNILSGGAATTLVNVDDAAKQRSGQDMGVTLDSNAYHRPPGSPVTWLVGWSDWPRRMLANTTMADVRSGTQQELRGLALEGVVEPLFDSRGNWVLRGDSPARGAGAPLPANIAAAIGVPVQVAPDLGALRLQSGSQPTPVPAASPAGAQPVAVKPLGEGLTRLAGPSRVHTAAAVSAASLEGARTVVLAPAYSSAEALLGAPLAAVLDASVLISGPEALEPAVLHEIRRLGAAEVVVVGRPDQLPSGLETTLGELGAKVRWLSAPDVYTLSAVVAAEIAAQGGGVGEVLIARGEAPDPSQVWPDALSASALAAHQRAPILLTPTDRLAPTVAQALSRLRPAHIRIVGGEAAVGPAVAAEARTVAGASSVERLSGPNRFATSVAVADAGIRAGLTGTGAWVATGRAFPDALVAGPAAARAGMPLLLLDGVSSTGAPEARSFLEGRRASLRSIVVLGGEAAVTGPVSESLRSLAGLPG